MATIDASPASLGEKTQAVVDTFSRYVVPNYKRYPVCLVRGTGSKVWDAEGNEYLDLFPGWGCNLLGHCPEPVVRAVQEQVAKLIHVPNTWYTELQGEWAKLLSERSFGGQAFFCNWMVSQEGSQFLPLQSIAPPDCRPERLSRLVVQGMDLDPTALEDTLADCLLSDAVLELQQAPLRQRQTPSHPSPAA